MFRTVLIISLAFSCASVGDEVKTYRKLFFEATDSKSSLNELVSKLKASESEHYLVHAYRGVASAMAAEHASGASNKLKLFNLGKLYLENVIKDHPNDIEPKFLRLTVQENAPFFLGYRGSRESDKNDIIAGLTQARKDKQDNFFIKKVVSYMKTLDLCTDSDREKLKNI